MAKVFEQLGITEAMQAKAKYGAGGAAGLAGLVVLRGEADIGIQQMAELIAVSGIDVVGPLPADIQSATMFTAGIPTSASHPEAARVVIDFLTTPAAKSTIKAKGLEPADRRFSSSILTRHSLQHIRIDHIDRRPAAYALIWSKMSAN